MVSIVIKYKNKHYIKIKLYNILHMEVEIENNQFVESKCYIEVNDLLKENVYQKFEILARGV